VVGDVDIPSSEEPVKSAVSYCDQHPGEQNECYCYDCKLVTCYKCLVDKHIYHKWTDVNKSAEKFCEELKDDIEKFSGCASHKQMKLEQRETEGNSFLEKIASTQSEISQRYDKLISLIQSHQNQLMEELNQFKNKLLKEIETVKDEIERQSVITESFKRYCREMINKGTACDISRMVHDLHARAEELVKTQDEPDCRPLSGIEITFRTFVATTDSVKNLIGELMLKGVFFVNNCYFLSFCRQSLYS